MFVWYRNLQKKKYKIVFGVGLCVFFFFLGNSHIRVFENKKIQRTTQVYFFYCPESSGS